jgi:hypothetical protein
MGMIKATPDLLVNITKERKLGKPIQCWITDGDMDGILTCGDVIT